MSLPGLLCLYLFFIVPLVTLLKIALSVRAESGSTNVEFQWEWSNFSKAFTDFGEQLWRAFAYAGDRHRALRADRLPDRLLHRLQGGEVGATSCSGW